MPSNPLVSIIIPVYNADKWIFETIQSCLNQTWANLEIIAVDDGSSDSSLRIMQNIKAKNLKIISQENKGGCAARNLGLKYAQGDYIQYLDADDLLAPEKINVQMNRLLPHDPYTIASGPFAHFMNEPYPASFIADSGWRDYDNPLDWLYESLIFKAMFPVQVWLTSRENIVKTGEWDESIRYLVDNEFFARVLINSQKILFCPEAKSYYRKGHLSASHIKDLPGLRSRYKSKFQVVKNILQAENSDRMKYASAVHLHQFLYGIYPLERQLSREIEYEIDLLGLKFRKNISNGRMKIIGDLFGWKSAKWLRYFYYSLFRTGYRI
jgi:glycosyltransferase involved in cell wall biosynthesis